MRLPVVLLCCSLAGIIGGAALISLPAVGGAVIFDSLIVGLLAADRHLRIPPQVREVRHDLPSILARMRDAA
jgi:hypothetical protein